jgi:Ni/Co efflux regulator RcnB
MIQTVHTPDTWAAHHQTSFTTRRLNVKTSTIVCTIAVASLGLNAMSFAQGDDRRGARDEQRQDQRQNMQRNEHGDMHRRDDRRDEFQGESRNDRPYYYNARSPEFKHGEHIPRELRNHQYVVTDYRAHHLNPPPRGHQWVQVGSDYVLIAIVTGVIANIILGH